MNKGELISEIAAQTGISKTDTGSVVDGFVGQIEKSLQGGSDVALVGFGTWKKKARAARTGRNPQTGETIQIAAKNTVTFSAGKSLKDAMN
jgi:DNA-binding protein HU-beta